MRHWRPERKYYKGFSKGTDIHLFYFEHGKKKKEVIRNYPFYFLIRLEDFRKHRDYLRKLIVQKVKSYKKHPIGDWVRVYARKWHGRWDKFDVWYEPGETNKLGNIEDIVSEIAMAMPVYEADLSPLHRFLTDNDVTIDEDPKLLYLDIESDDTDPGFTDEHLERNRILSFSWFSDLRNTETTMFEKIHELTDEAERALLINIGRLMTEHASVGAWNGSNYDFRALRLRARALGLSAKWDSMEDSICHVDLMECTKRNSDSGEFQYFGLDAVANNVLGRGKVKHDGRIIDLWKHEPELFEKYSIMDTALMVGIEKERHYYLMDVLTAKIGNRFSNYYWTGRKVEGALLRESNLKSWHYPTLKKVAPGAKVKRKAEYEGGYVLDPKAGVYEGAATFDFKSLYPSLIRTYNISPDTKVKVAADMQADNNVITTPVTGEMGIAFARGRIGIVPGLVEKLNAARAEVERKRDEYEYDTPEYNRHKYMGLAYKIICLACYGVFGEKRSRFYDLDIARKITLLGQYYIKKTESLAVLMKFDVISGDTDSIFVRVDRERVDELPDKAARFYAKICERYGAKKNLIKLDFENYFGRLIYTGVKKRYFGALVYRKGKDVDPPLLHYRGFELRRSDAIAIARELQKRVMEMIALERANPEDVLTEVLKVRKRIQEGTVDVDEITCYQGLQNEIDGYEGPLIDSKTGQPKIKKDGEVQKKTKPVHARVADRMREKGNLVYVGMQVPYIVVGTSPVEGIPVDEYEGMYDKIWYWNVGIYPVVERILSSVWSGLGWTAHYTDGRKEIKDARQMRLM